MCESGDEWIFTACCAHPLAEQPQITVCQRALTSAIYRLSDHAQLLALLKRTQLIQDDNNKDAAKARNLHHIIASLSDLTPPWRIFIIIIIF